MRRPSAYLRLCRDRTDTLNLILAGLPLYNPIAEEAGNLCGYAIGCDDEGSIEMDIALGDAVRGVTEQAGDGQFRESEIAGDAGKGVAKYMGRYAFELGTLADTGKYADHADEMTFTKVGRKHIRRFCADGDFIDAVERRLTERTNLFSAFGIRKMHTVPPALCP